MYYSKVVETYLLTVLLMKQNETKLGEITREQGNIVKDRKNKEEKK